MTHALLPTLEGLTLGGRAMRLPQDLPPRPVALVLGFAHEARMDVAAWKKALATEGLPFLSVPVAPMELTPQDMAPTAAAMRAHVPDADWENIVQVHQGGPGLLEAMGWTAEPRAKVIVTDRAGSLLAVHGDGPFSEAAFQRLRTALRP